MKNNLPSIFETLESWRVKSFYQSFSFHLFFLFLILAVTYIHFWKEEEEGRVIVPSIQVDVVSMPKFTLEELRKMDLDVSQDVAKEETKVDEKKEVKDENESEVKPTEVKDPPPAQIDDLLKELSKKKVKPSKIETKDNNKKIELSDEKREQLKRLALEGNKLMQGQAVEGLSDQQLQEEIEIYTAQLSSRIKNFWILPSYLIDRPLRTRIKIFIDGTGKLLSHEVLSSSGEAEFDQRAVQSIMKAAPFMIPHKDIVPRLLRGNIVIVFPL
ncbi:MAG: cell envelope integrity protein TolA [Bacteriovoracaceae bacterium]|nr:cell envelope integrity protein TolA [Bacteriovoracaceae bacterium]